MIKGKRALNIFRFLEFFFKCLSFREKILEFEFFVLSLSFWALECFSRRLKKTPDLVYSHFSKIKIFLSVAAARYIRYPQACRFAFTEVYL